MINPELINLKQLFCLWRQESFDLFQLLNSRKSNHWYFAIIIVWLLLSRGFINNNSFGAPVPHAPPCCTHPSPSTSNEWRNVSSQNLTKGYSAPVWSSRDSSSVCLMIKSDLSPLSITSQTCQIIRTALHTCLKYRFPLGVPREG